MSHTGTQRFYQQLGRPVPTRLGPPLVPRLGATWRLRLSEAPEMKNLPVGEPVLYCFWHGDLWVPLFHYRGSGVVVLVSGHRDGRMVGRVPKGLGFDTVIGERGVRLSGGQKQRTALARAIIKNPPILILDDAFSSVDVETEEEILRELKQFLRGRTTLLISHRISTVRDADRIIYLRGGEIIEQGTHDTLIARCGAYYELYRRQSVERQVESMGPVERRL